MEKVKLGIIREGKVPVDKRVPFTPVQAREVMDTFDNIEVICQSSGIRCFQDDEYLHNGVRVEPEVSSCDILMGVKEVPLDQLISEKTYFFFSHTIKEQPYNRKLLQAILEKNIRLIDYEVLTDADGTRIVAFGRYAGIVGAYNGIWTFGKRYNLFHLRRAHECFDLEDLKTEYKKVSLPPVKIVVTGGGRVSKGAMEVLNGMGIRKVSPAEFLTERFESAVYCQLNSRDYNTPKGGGEFVRGDFYKNPEHYEGDFLKYARVSDILIAGAYWDPRAPVLFRREDVMKPDFKIRVIADITCDIEGSIPSTKRPCTIDEPIYDYNPSEDKVETPLSDEGNITVMAVDNLPCELPRNASGDFGRELIDNVLPHLLGDDSENVIKRATIAENGRLTERYSYLQNYVEGKLSNQL
ncbi:Lysine ketoglutarate reductase [Fulvivirga imtechensis AK7]|uniref:Saccharopine dehydrogenase [NAD(+), L-lysine-forming] n=1 Tax=Fulvivirga imtechensis AK7 TaxID=1237149 RepID=L8JP37_9BACT|nr:NAD(P)-dependent oxidoreductase [Fulvivirga imtechensis]ELR69963.1 Lysine ketoglutarate reductase [Fulvivirga imtechensis AK7]